MELRGIRTFLAIADTGSFSRAAEKLGYTQSAVTMQIKQLERELGTRLFDRTPRRAELTDQGRAFAFHAAEATSALEKAAASARAAGSAQASDPAAVTGTLRIGSAESVSTALLPELLVQFHRRCPQVELVVSTAQRGELVDGLRTNALDVFFTMEKKFSAPGLVRTLLREEEVVFAAPPNMAHGGSPLTFHELAGLPFVLTERGESYRYELDRLMADADEEIAPIVEAGNTETLVHLAERGVGATFLPRFSVEAAFAAGTLVPLSTCVPEVRMWSQLFVHKNKWVSPALEIFLDETRAFFSADASRC